MNSILNKFYYMVYCDPLLEGKCQICGCDPNDVERELSQLTYVDYWVVPRFIRDELLNPASTQVASVTGPADQL